MVEMVQRVPIQVRAQRTRAALLGAAERLFASGGYAATTAKSIAAEAGVATGSFYQYFRDKDAVLHELAAARLSQLLQQARAAMDALPATALQEPDPVELQASLQASIRLVLNLHQHDAGLHAVLTERCLTDPKLARITVESDRALLALIQQLLSVLPDVTDAQASALVIFGMIEGTIHKQVFGKTGIADDRVITAISDAVLRMTSLQVATPPKTPTGEFP